MTTEFCGERRERRSRGSAVKKIFIHRCIISGQTSSQREEERRRNNSTGRIAVHGMITIKVSYSISCVEAEGIKEGSESQRKILQEKHDIIIEVVLDKGMQFMVL
jgi:hypothetical protein